LELYWIKNTSKKEKREKNKETGRWGEIEEGGKQ
jgi:hypothetical protein